MGLPFFKNYYELETSVHENHERKGSILCDHIYKAELNTMKGISYIYESKLEACKIFSGVIEAVLKTGSFCR